MADCTACAAGALLGPMLLSVLSVFYKLHAKLFRDEADVPERAMSPVRAHDPVL